MIMKAFVYFFATLFVIFCIWFFWDMGRRINYRLSYRDMVQHEIKDMVKREALK